MYSYTYTPGCVPAMLAEKTTMQIIRLSQGMISREDIGRWSKNDDLYLVSLLKIQQALKIQIRFGNKGRQYLANSHGFRQALIDHKIHYESLAESTGIPRYTLKSFFHDRRNLASANRWHLLAITIGCRFYIPKPGTPTTQSYYKQKEGN